jgi:hypothetical protein
MTPVRRSDGELCGFVAERGERWCALTVFGVTLGEWDDESDAHHEVHERGLAVLAERWMLTDGSSGDSRIACVQQASPTEVTLALDYYSLPGVPTITIGVDDLAAGRWTLTPAT